MKPIDLMAALKLALERRREEARREEAAVRRCGTAGTSRHGGINVARFHNGDYVDYLVGRKPTRRAIVSYRPGRDTYRVRCYGDVLGYGGGHARDICYHRKDARAAFELAIRFVDEGAGAVAHQHTGGAW